jgi:hypothetical protein
LPTYQVSLKVTGLTPSAFKKELLTKKRIYQKSWQFDSKQQVNNNKTFYMISHKDLMHILISG